MYLESPSSPHQWQTIWGEKKIYNTAILLVAEVHPSHVDEVKEWGPSLIIWHGCDISGGKTDF